MHLLAHSLTLLHVARGLDELGLLRLLGLLLLVGNRLGSHLGRQGLGLCGELLGGGLSLVRQERLLCKGWLNRLLLWKLRWQLLLLLRLKGLHWLDVLGLLLHLLLKLLLVLLLFFLLHHFLGSEVDEALDGVGRVFEEFIAFDGLGTVLHELKPQGSGHLLDRIALRVCFEHVVQALGGILDEVLLFSFLFFDQFLLLGLLLAEERPGTGFS